MGRSDRGKQGEFGRQARKVRRLALLYSMLLTLSRFVGYCFLTWASVVVLGGFVSDLDKPEFLRASLLLLLQAVHVGTAASWYTFLPPTSLTSSNSHAPPATARHGRSWSTIATAVATRERAKYFATIGYSCDLLSFFVAISELLFLPRASKGPAAVNIVYISSLRIFYILVLLNATVAMAGLLVAMREISLVQASASLKIYFETVVRVALQKGHQRANGVELVDTAFEMMSEECRKSVTVAVPASPQAADRLNGKAVPVNVLYSSCKELVSYVYKHERGFEAALAAMESKDRYVQEAAALMAGFWVELESKLGGPPRLEGSALERKLRQMAADESSVKGPTQTAAKWSLAKLNQSPEAALADTDLHADERFRENFKVSYRERIQALASHLLVLTWSASLAAYLYYSISGSHLLKHWPLS